jgi:hypothetical protein
MVLITGTLRLAFTPRAGGDRWDVTGVSHKLLPLDAVRPTRLPEPLMHGDVSRLMTQGFEQLRARYSFQDRV